MLQFPTQPDFGEILPMVLLLVFFIGFLFQMVYFWIFFSRLAFFRQKGSPAGDNPVSVVICARNEYQNLRDNLPHILDQDYPHFEVIVVNDSSDDGTAELLEFFKQRYGHLKVFNLTQNLNFFKGKKFPLALGIKSASYDIILLTDADCKPYSNQWIRTMQSGFDSTTDIVLGYGTYRKTAGLLNKLIRFDTFHIGVQYLSMALAGRPYMGVGRNLSYRKKLFYEVKGFSSHYTVSSGDDDLFINRVAKGKNTRIMISGPSHMASEAKKSLKKWLTQKRRHFSTSRYYSGSSRWTIGLYGISKFLMYAFLVPLLVLNYNSIITLPLIATYFITLMIIFTAASKKLDESDLLIFSPIFDLLMTFFNPLVYVTVMVSRPRKWK